MEQSGDVSDPRLRVFELDGELFFGAEVELAGHFAAVTQSVGAEVKAVVLILERGRNPDAGFLTLLRVLTEHLRAQGVVLLLSGVLPDLMTCLTTTRLAETIGADHIFRATSPEQSGAKEAIAFAFRLLDEELCSEEVKSVHRRERRGC